MPELKSFFDTPKKTRLTVLCLLVALATLGCAAAYIIIYLVPTPSADTPPAQSEAVSSAPGESDKPAESHSLMGVVPSLTIDEARELALAHAGVAEEQADVSREALSEDNGVWVYEFRFHAETTQYEYKINANTGEVRSLIKETVIYPSAEVAESPAVGSAPPAEPASQPSAEPASSESPASDPVASQPPAAASPSPEQPASLYIGMERAKAIALEHAGLSAGQVIFTHASTRREQGTMIYEIEFRQGRVKYGYEIDAATGSILGYERDAD